MRSCALPAPQGRKGTSQALRPLRLVLLRGGRPLSHATQPPAMGLALMYSATAPLGAKAMPNPPPRPRPRAESRLEANGPRVETGFPPVYLLYYQAPTEIFTRRLERRAIEPPGPPAANRHPPRRAQRGKIFRPFFPRKEVSVWSSVCSSPRRREGRCSIIPQEDGEGPLHKQQRAHVGQPRLLCRLSRTNREAHAVKVGDAGMAAEPGTQGPTGPCRERSDGRQGPGAPARRQVNRARRW
jgi:hypothetical protein